VGIFKDYTYDTTLSILAFWIRALPENVTNPQLGNKFPALNRKQNNPPLAPILS